MPDHNSFWKLLAPACGTGGMVAEAQNYLRDPHGEAKLYVYGQDYNKRAFATAASDNGYEPDADLRDFDVPLKDDIDASFDREVRPHVPDAWMDRSKDKVGYEINFNRHFYKYTPPRPLEVIDAELKQAEEEIMRLLREVTE